MSRNPDPRPGLRERKRIDAMRRIQDVAIALFDERGFDDVAVEEIAAKADVSASSIYRYYETKEGILIHDEYEEPLMTALLELLVDHDLYEAAELALARISRGHFQQDDAMSLRRARYFVEVPAVRAAVHLRIDQAAARIAAALAHPDHRPPRDSLQSHVVANSVLWGLFAAAEQVVADPGGQSLEAAFHSALDAISPRER